MDTAERALVAKQRMAGLKAAYIVKERSCSSCRFGPIDGSGRGKCEHFAHWDIKHEPLSGHTSLRIPVNTAEARSEGGLCGPEGLLFEPFSARGKIARFYAINTDFRLYATVMALMALAASAAAIFLE